LPVVNLAPTSKTLIMWNKTEVTPLGTARITVTNYQKEEILCGVPCSDEKINPLHWSKSCTRHEDPNNTLGQF